MEHKRFGGEKGQRNVKAYNRFGGCFKVKSFGIPRQSRGVVDLITARCIIYHSQILETPIS